MNHAWAMVAVTILYSNTNSVFSCHTLSLFSFAVLPFTLFFMFHIILHFTATFVARVL